MNIGKRFAIVALIALFTILFQTAGSTVGAGPVTFFPETGHSVQGLFLTYWQANGGLAQQGFPISEEMQERSDTDGKVYTMQYFERAVFEQHPENRPPFDVLLSLLGTFYYNEKYAGNAPNQHTSTDNPRKFPETGKTIGGLFRKYWEAHGGLAQQGYPISDEFTEVSRTDGKPYTVQYFQRAVFEYHPEFAGTQNEVLLSLLGVFYYDKKHGGAPQPTVTPRPTRTAGPTATPTAMPVRPTGQLLFFNGTDGRPALLDQRGSLFYQPILELPPKQTQPPWSLVTSIGGGYLHFYNFAGGGLIARVDASGGYQLIQQPGYDPGWTQIAPLGNYMLALFNSDTKKLLTQVVGVDGNPINLQTTTLSLAWEHVVGGFEVRPGYLFFYMDNPADKFERKMVARVNTQGNLTPIYAISERARAGVPRGSWVIEPIGDNRIFRYNTVSGQYYIETIAEDDGAITTSPVKSMEPGWTNFLFYMPTDFLGAHNLFLAYRSDTGDAVVRTFDASYNFSDLKSYQGPDALSPALRQIIGIR